MKFENTWTGNWEGAFHGLRHPMESYAKSDSGMNCVDNPTKLCDPHCTADNYCQRYRSKWILGPNDLDLAQRMIKAGTPNDKFLRQIFVSVDITAPLYWWKEMDQYKVGTVTDSTSTMHKITSKEITEDDFSFDDDWDLTFNLAKASVVENCENLRQKFLNTQDKRYWRALIQLLPEGYNQTRTWTANYQVLRNIYFQRRNHKLLEWHEFCSIIECLPYGRELITIGG